MGSEVHRMNIKYETVFEKKDAAVYISHLDLMTLFRRAIRRAMLPFVLSGGFTPRVKISMPKALKLGVPSSNETMVFMLQEAPDENETMEKINEQLAEGVRLLTIKRV